MMYIYYCENCQTFRAFKGRNDIYMCSDCGDELLFLDVSLDAWNTYTNDQMLDTIDNAKAGKAIKKPVFRRQKWKRHISTIIQNS